jgi:hypothetical protein
LRIPITADDVGYAVEEIYRGRSVVSGLASRLALCRWRKPEGAFIDTSVKGQKSSNVQVGELVCMTKDEVAQHEKLVLKGDKTPEEVYDAKVIKLVEERMAEEAKYRDQR